MYVTRESYRPSSRFSSTEDYVIVLLLWRWSRRASKIQTWENSNLSLKSFSDVIVRSKSFLETSGPFHGHKSHYGRPVLIKLCWRTCKASSSMSNSHWACVIIFQPHKTLLCLRCNQIWLEPRHWPTSRNQICKCQLVVQVYFSLVDCKSKKILMVSVAPGRQLCLEVLVIEALESMVKVLKLSGTPWRGLEDMFGPLFMQFVHRWQTFPGAQALQTILPVLLGIDLVSICDSNLDLHNSDRDMYSTKAQRIADKFGSFQRPIYMDIPFFWCSQYVWCHQDISLAQEPR